MDSEFILFLFAISLIGVGSKSGPVFAAWLRAHRSAAPLGLISIWSMFLKNVPLEPVVDAHVSARTAGVRICLKQLAAHAKAGGDIRAVVDAYIETLRAGTAIDFARVCEIELDEGGTNADGL